MTKPLIASWAQIERDIESDQERPAGDTESRFPDRDWDVVGALYHRVAPLIALRVPVSRLRWTWLALFFLYWLGRGQWLAWLDVMSRRRSRDDHPAC